MWCSLFLRAWGLLTPGSLSPFATESEMSLPRPRRRLWFRGRRLDTPGRGGARSVSPRISTSRLPLRRAEGRVRRRLVEGATTHCSWHRPMSTRIAAVGGGRLPGHCVPRVGDPKIVRRLVGGLEVELVRVAAMRAVPGCPFFWIGVLLKTVRREETQEKICGIYWRFDMRGRVTGEIKDSPGLPVDFVQLPMPYNPLGIKATSLLLDRHQRQFIMHPFLGFTIRVALHCLLRCRTCEMFTTEIL